MKNVISAILVLLCLAVSTTNVHADFKKTKIAVLDFRLQGNDFETKDMGKIVAEWLITAFVREGRFEVIERKLLGEVLEEQKMVEAGIVNQDTASEIGKLLGVKVIISGSVLKIRDVVEVNARIVDVASASIITAESVRSSNVTSLHDLVKEMAAKIIKNFPLEGYIAHRQGSDVVIDLGRQYGVKQGMYFLAYREGDVVKHPKTGDVLYVTQIRTGVIKITYVQDKISKGVILEENESDAIKYGNLVKSTKNGKFKKTASEIPRVDPQPVVRKQEGRQAQPVYQAQPEFVDVPSTVYEDGQLFVDTEPSQARIRVLNIKPKYYQGISLPAGDYQVEVSARGYRTSTGWYSLGEGELKRISVKLQAYRRQTVVPPSGSGLQKYFDMLWSKTPAKTRQAARLLYKRHAKNNAVVETAHEVLEARFQELPRDSDHVDAMAYLCNILGNSRQIQHSDLLRMVSRKAPSRKLRSYAEKNLRRIVR